MISRLQVTLSLLILGVVVWAYAVPVPAATEADPFGSILPSAAPEAAPTPVPPALGLGTPLQHERVSLRYLDAAQAAQSFACLSSARGRIEAAKAGGAVDVFDTPAELAHVVATLRQADQRGPGRVVETISLHHVEAASVAEALQTLVSESGVVRAIERSNTLLVADTEANVEAVKAEVLRLDQPHRGLEIETVNLRFLDAANLQPVVTKMLTGFGHVAVNASSNSLILCDTWENLPRVLEAVRQADKTPEQIMVEVVLLDVQLSDDSEIGVNWDMVTHDLSTVRYRQNFTSRVTSTLNDETTVGDATVFNSAGALAGDLGIVVGNVRTVVHLIQESRQAEIIASPRALVVSGHTARIKAVEEVPYRQILDTSQGGQQAISSTAFKDVGVTLEVTATVLDANGIFVTVQTDQNVRTGQSSDDVPVVDTRSEETSLLLRDGQTVVMGGLRRRGTVTAVQKIPVLGDIPLLGALFRRHVDVAESSELVVLLSPHLYRDAALDAELQAKVDGLKRRSTSKELRRDKVRRWLTP